jgi:hypothetical protein
MTDLVEELMLLNAENFIVNSSKWKLRMMRQVLMGNKRMNLFPDYLLIDLDGPRRTPVRITEMICLAKVQEKA